jgi:3',5'-cyclic AMP phosphodiesterase CpdA
MFDDLGDRRGFLKCMAWAGTGSLFAFSGGIGSSIGLDAALATGRPAAAAPFTFVQLSDSHISFNKPPNADAKATFREAIAKVRALPNQPDFVIHTGDVSQLSRDEEFDDAEQMLKEAGLPVFFVPGEHDMLDPDGGKAFLNRFGKGSRGAGWYSFDHRGVHFVALVNVADLKPGGMGNLGREQLEWLKGDLAGRSSSMPIVVFAHIPLWTVYADWGWGTDDAAEALKLLARFGSVTILNGHIYSGLWYSVIFTGISVIVSTLFLKETSGRHLQEI